MWGILKLSAASVNVRLADLWGRHISTGSHLGETKYLSNPHREEEYALLSQFYLRLVFERGPARCAECPF
jgi:hypothetical protein